MIDAEKLFKNVIEIWRALGKESNLKVSGSSMLPLIKNDNIAVVKSDFPRNIRIGDIIAFRYAQKIYVHRVLRIYTYQQKLFFIEKGDNSQYLGIVPEDDLIGRIIAIKKGNEIIKLNTKSWYLVNHLLGIYSRGHFPYLVYVTSVKAHSVINFLRRAIGV